jgi:hypothetical protein
VNGVCGVEADSSQNKYWRAKAAILTKNDLTGLCTNISPPKQNYEKLQPLLEGFKC